jgi:NAD(P)-dependent dehydrogenase (short-subunit alcohol dehydrogenase family)
LALGSRGFAQVLDALPDPNRGGLGVLEALHWLHGGRVYGTSRIASTGAGLRLQMDVTDDAPVQRAIDTIIEREGRLDISANNAGIAIRGPAGAS